MRKSKITGMGFHLPEQVVTNQDLTAIMDTSDEWIQARSGIQERRWVTEDEAASDLAIPASKKAMNMAGVAPEDIDLVIVATLSADYFFPGAGVMVQDMMDMNTVGALDVRNQCSGFIYGLSIAEQYIKSGTYQNILVVGSEVQSTALDLSNNGRDTAVIFADGAGAAVLSTTDKNQGILSTKLRSEGKFSKELWVESPSSSNGFPRITKNDIDEGKQFLKMNGQTVFKMAVKYFPEIILESLDSVNMSIENVDLLITCLPSPEICAEVMPSYLISNSDEIVSRHEIKHFDVNQKAVVIEDSWLPDRRPLNVVVTSGASCPDIIMNQVIDRLVSFFGYGEEDISEGLANLSLLDEELA